MPWAMGGPKDLDAHLLWVRKSRGEFDLNADFTYGVFDSDENVVVGGTGLHTRPGPKAWEIGYWIDKAHTRRSLATETAAALAKVAFLVGGVRRVEIHCDPANTSSAAATRPTGLCSSPRTSLGA